MSVFATILIVEDEKNAREGMQQFLESKGYDVITARDGNEGWQIFLKEKPDLILTDIRMPEMDGISLLERIIASGAISPVILLTAYGTVEDAVKAMKKGAYYYLTKPLNLEELEFLVTKALTSRDLTEENIELRQALFQEKYDRGEIIYKSRVMRELFITVDKIAQSSASVLIEGESGTGKELVAHRVHDLSSRKNSPFIAVHCASLTETLLASELFGHEKGSFTGAMERKVGRFERAHLGTLFLDEIGEISQEMQVKLLRVLQEGEFERVGGTKTIKVDVRLICATSKNLRAEVRSARFREDLYYRINVIYLKLPALRDRKEDIPILVDHFINHFARVNNRKISGIDPDALLSMMNYSWPGNIRELKNMIERIVVLSASPQIQLSSLPDDIRSSASPSLIGSEKLSDMERDHITRALRDCKGNKSLAAKKLGISRRTLYRKIGEYRIS